MGLSNSKADEDLERILTENTNACLIFSKPACRFSKAAISLCNDLFPPSYVAIHKVRINVVEASPELILALKRKTGRATVPNAYIRGKQIGDFDELIKTKRIPMI